MGKKHNNEQVRVGIVGGAGYTGGELIRILINHPGTTLAFVHSRTHGGKFLYEIHEDLVGETNSKFSDKFEEADVLFLCVGQGEARKFLDENASLLPEARIIDLSHDYRLHHSGNRPMARERTFIYGLPELNKEQIRTAHNIANPGCFATAIQLGLLPLAKAGLLKEVYSTGITGSTGAGQSLTPTSHFSWRTNNIQAYKTLTHQHVKEITQSLQQLQSSFTHNINFVPWRGDFTRGIFISSQIHCDRSLEELTRLYSDFYRDQPFTILSKEPIFLKQVVNTNKCLIQLEKTGNMLVIHSAIDNLLKGASGQAVQNMNLLFGMDETTGLRFKASFF
jgi:N-acetyl-gamma-glutamyl-phosphate reductase